MLRLYIGWRGKKCNLLSEKEMISFLKPHREGEVRGQTKAVLTRKSVRLVEQKSTN